MLVLYIILIIIFTFLLYLCQNNEKFIDNNNNYTIETIENKILYNKENKTIYLTPIWGMCNQLRTLRKYYADSIDNNYNIILFKDDSTDYTFDFSKIKGIPFKIITSLPPNIKHNLNPGKCECESDHNKDNTYYNCCDLWNDKYNNDNRFYNIILPSVNHDLGNHIKNNNVIGVHIRQGTEYDYNKQYFFSHWQQDNKDVNMCCYDNDEASCAPAAANLQLFINEMSKGKYNKYEFFICTDRNNCIKQLLSHYKFYDKLLYNDIDAFNEDKDFIDFYCLSQCNKIICASYSSFSKEASVVNNTELIYVN